MVNHSSKFCLLGGGLECVGKIMGRIFNYLASNDLETLNDRDLLRELHETGCIDEIKSQDYSERPSKVECDPEELQIPV